MTMIAEYESLVKKIEEELPLIQDLIRNPMIKAPFWEDFEIRFCWSSNAIEGNTLSLDETIDFLLYDEVQSSHTYQEYTEAKNLYRTIQQYFPFSKEEITEDWTMCVNAMMRDKQKGYREKNVFIGTMTDAVFYPPDYKKVPELMKEISLEWNDLEGTLKEVLEKITELYFRFERIHPFEDGNGRTGRMILNRQLINIGLLPIALDKISKYRRCFKVYEHKKDVSLLMRLICKSELEAMQRVKELQSKYKEAYS